MSSPINDIDLGIGDSSDEEIEISASDVLEQLEEAWKNEKFAPDILECKSELVECMLTHLRETEESLEGASNSDVLVSLQRLEVDRVRFVIASYLRTRLHKIDEYVLHVYSDEHLARSANLAKLSPKEQIYAKELSENLESTLKTMVLDKLPPNVRKLNKKTVPRPNLNSYVFMQMKETQSQVMIDPEEDPFDLDKGSQHIVRFNPIAPFVIDGTASLV